MTGTILMSEIITHFTETFKLIIIKNFPSFAEKFQQISIFHRFWDYILSIDRETQHCGPSDDSCNDYGVYDLLL